MSAKHPGCLYFGLIALAAALILSGCTGGGSLTAVSPPNPPPPPPGPPGSPVIVSISPQSAALTFTQTQQFTVTLQNASNLAVTWSVDGVTGGSAAAGTISPLGLYTAPSAAGTHTVTVTSVQDPTKSASAPVAVTAPVSVSISPQSAALTFTQTQQFTVTLQNASNLTVTWSVDGVAGGSASAGTISPLGLYTAPSAAGAHTVTVTSVQDPTKSASASIAVTAPVSVSISPQSAALTFTQTQQFIVTLQNASNLAVTWSVDGTPGGSAAAGTISPLGLYTAPSAAGAHTVTVTSVQDPTKSASASVAVTAPVSVSISPKHAPLTLTQAQQFTVTLENANNMAVTWSVDGVVGGSAAAGTISPSGLYAPPSAAGTHTVTVTSVQDPTKSASASVFVSNLAGVFNYHNDPARTGQNLRELALTPAMVVPATFGKLFACPVDGYVYAQPLYVAGVSIPGSGARNVVYVATEHDSVYAFDADDPGCVLYWQASFINDSAGVTTVPSDDLACSDIIPEVGITGTPVIEPASQTLYLVAATKENGNYVFRLHALDLSSGQENFGGPVTIQAAVPGSGDGAVNGVVSLDAFYANQRAALLLSRGVVYIAFASHCDVNPYHGWLLAYDAATLQALPAPFDDTPNGSKGGIWQSGCGPSADPAGNIFLITGNGTFDTNTGGVDFGNSFLRLVPTANGPSLADFFTPFDEAALSSLDLDVGATGPVLFPDSLGSADHPHLLLGAGKAGFGYLLDRDSLGGFNPLNNNQIVQYIQLSMNGIFSTPAVWLNNVYLTPTNDFLQAYEMSGGLLSSSPVAMSPNQFPFPGPTPSVSANGSTAGIVWVIDSSEFAASGPAVLHAYDATNVATELYNSAESGIRDQAGPAVKFTVPTVANGHVYIGNQDQLTVYGLLP